MEMEGGGSEAAECGSVGRCGDSTAHEYRLAKRRAAAVVTATRPHTATCAVMLPNMQLSQGFMVWLEIMTQATEGDASADDEHPTYASSNFLKMET